MLKLFRRVFGLKDRTDRAKKTVEADSNSDAWDPSPNDWIEPAISIAESELDLTDLPAVAGKFARQIVRDAMADQLELPIMPELALIGLISIIHSCATLPFFQVYKTL